MKVLFSAGPMYGHVNTLLPLALAAQRAGHDVVLATASDLLPHVARHGLATWAAGATLAEGGGSRQASWLAYFADSAGPRARDLMPLAKAWQPDLVIHEETDLAGPVVAALLGVRHAVHGLGLMPPRHLWAKLVDAIDRIGESFGLAGAGAALRAATYLHICPPALQPPGEPWCDDVLALRPVAGVPGFDDRLPEAIASLPFAQTLHLTLGTVFNGATEVLASAIAGLRELPLNLVVTVGPGADPALFGRQPRHVLIERYLPHTLLLPRCRLVVSQGGAGILLGALSHGLPQLVIPQGGDQFMNAAACESSGAGLCLNSPAPSAHAIAAAATRLLEEPSFTRAARGVQAQIEAMPDADAVMAQLAVRGRVIA